MEREQAKNSHLRKKRRLVQHTAYGVFSVHITFSMSLVQICVECIYIVSKQASIYNIRIKSINTYKWIDEAYRVNERKKRQTERRGEEEKTKCCRI